jgi:hypothetical protein
VKRFSLAAAIGWSATWAVGAAIGVALGAYLTVAGAAAGADAGQLDETELLVLPLLAAAVVFSASFIARALAALLRRGPEEDVRR